MSHGEPMAARGDGANPLGKCTGEVKAWVPECVREELTMLAALRRQSLSEYVRDLLTKHTHGEAEFVRLRLHAGGGSAGTGTQAG